MSSYRPNWIRNTLATFDRRFPGFPSSTVEKSCFAAERPIFFVVNESISNFRFRFGGPTFLFSIFLFHILGFIRFFFTSGCWLLTYITCNRLSIAKFIVNRLLVDFGSIYGGLLRFRLTTFQFQKSTYFLQKLFIGISHFQIVSLFSDCLHLFLFHFYIIRLLLVLRVMYLGLKTFT